MSDPNDEAHEDAEAPGWAHSLLTFDMDAHALAHAARQLMRIGLLPAGEADQA